ncbi:MAG TPA: hypothetical protein VGB17_09640 [Pyrinomonadaceae bacterium]|jgi:hypothetical protein
MPDQTETCAHAPCNCPAQMMGDYCGERCERAATGEIETECHCGHPQCGPGA